MYLRSVFGLICLQSFDAVLFGLSLHQHRPIYNFVVMGEYALKIAFLIVAVKAGSGTCQRPGLPEAVRHNRAKKRQGPERALPEALLE